MATRPLLKPIPAEHEMSRELLHILFHRMSPETFKKARLVNRKWRSEADEYLKRRLLVEVNNSETEPMTDIRIHFKEKLQKLNLLNNLQIPDGNHVRLSLKLDFVEYRIEFSPLIIALILQQPWISRVTHLSLDPCLSVDDWMGFRSKVLQRLENLVFLEVEFTGFRGDSPNNPSNL